jgi:ubiquinone/menaquinone biosynthesis C-methylase UbiE
LSGTHRDPLDELGYFAEWGGRRWEKLLGHAIHKFLGSDLSGQEVLEIGTCYGKTACLFALLGAQVTGVDLNQEVLDRAEAEARKWGVEAQTRFLCYDGDLDIFPDHRFDLLFTKSVLVMVPELEAFLNRASRKLKPGGKIVFLENARGHLLARALRYVKRPGRGSSGKIRYFTKRELQAVQDVFYVDILKRSFLPPIYLICGHGGEI